jgi:DUF4097 and DUF4098 domain-containing protein YvlB
MDTFPTPTPPRLTIEVRSGTLNIDTADVDVTTVDLAPLNDSDITMEALAATTVEQHGDDIVVIVPNRFGFIGRSPRLAVTITAPHGSRLGIKSGSADIVATGRFGTATVSTGSGDVTLGDCLDSLRVNSGSGDVRVASVAADVVVKTGSGDIDIVDIEGQATLNSGSGDVVVGGANRGLMAKTASGNITVGSAPPDLQATTASGDIRIDLASEGEVRAKAASGDIHAGVAAGTAAWLDVRTVSGRVASALDQGGEPTDDERRVRLHLTTVSGDIDLARV